MGHGAARVVGKKACRFMDLIWWGKEGEGDLAVGEGHLKSGFKIECCPQWEGGGLSVCAHFLLVLVVVGERSCNGKCGKSLSNLVEWWERAIAKNWMMIFVDRSSTW